MPTGAKLHLDAKMLKSLALPREAHETRRINSLQTSLGQIRLIESQYALEVPPKPFG
jgi:hypothetical protein